MKVYLVVIDYDLDGNNQPDSVFLNYENAKAQADEINDGYEPPLARVVEFMVADAD
jgi:hypothetical protein